MNNYEHNDCSSLPVRSSCLCHAWIINGSSSCFCLSRHCRSSRERIDAQTNLSVSVCSHITSVHLGLFTKEVGLPPGYIPFKIIRCRWAAVAAAEFQLLLLLPPLLPLLLHLALVLLNEALRESRVRLRSWSAGLVGHNYELLEAFMPLNMPVVKEVCCCCCCCCICCCCCCCWLLAWRPCLGTGGWRYSCRARVSTSIRSSLR